MNPEPLAWRKSRRSIASGECIEAAAAPGAVLVRDSTDRDGPVLAFGGRQWRAFTAGIRGAA